MFALRNFNKVTRQVNYCRSLSTLRPNTYLENARIYADQSVENFKECCGLNGFSPFGIEKTNGHYHPDIKLLYLNEKESIPFKASCKYFVGLAERFAYAHNYNRDLLKDDAEELIKKSFMRACLILVDDKEYNFSLCDPGMTEKEFERVNDFIIRSIDIDLRKEAFIRQEKHTRNFSVY